MNLNIEKVSVLHSKTDMDRVIIHTKDLPASTWPWKGTADLMMYVANGDGAQYVRDHFNVEPEITYLG